MATVVNFTISEVLNALKTTYKIEVNRLTVYNWITKGRSGYCMKASKDAAGDYTVTANELAAWVKLHSAASLQAGRGRPVALKA